MHHFISITLLITLLSLTPLAQSETTTLPNVGCAPSFVDIDNDGDKDAFIRADNGTIQYYENTGSATKPLFKKRTGNANPLNQANVGKDIPPKATTRQKRKVLEIVSVPETIFLTPEQSTADLFFSVNHLDIAESPSILVVAPRREGFSEEDREKAADLPDISYQFSGTIEDIFTLPGAYQVHYFIKDTEADDYVRSAPTLVYKQKKKGENQAPVVFNLFSPFERATTTTKPNFNWESSADPENELFTYALIIAKDKAFIQVVYREEGILESETDLSGSFFLTKGAKELTDATTHYWTVVAIDEYGAVTPSRHVFSFNTDGTNAGFNLDDVGGDGILGEPILPDNLIVNMLGGGRYEVNLTEMSNQVFTLQSAVPTEQVHPYEATYDPITGKVSIPGYGVMQIEQTPKQMNLKMIND
jgi:hypothetical protein